MTPPSAVPLKWRKYLALVDFGFITADELGTEIRRYRRSELRRFVSDIRSEIRQERRQGFRSLYVVKLVPADLPGQLPNLRLESYFNNCAFPYVRASRYSWGWPYSIEHTHLPRSSPLNESQIHSEFGYSLRCIEQEREKIEAFCAFLDSFSFKAYSLEYKIVGAQLKIIDWDTPHDRHVLGALNARAALPLLVSRSI